MRPVTIIGMGMSPQDLTARHHDLIAAADVLVGGRRHLAHFADLSAEKIEIGKGLSTLLPAIRSAARDRRVVVLASGDPLYYGVGAYLVRALGPENVRVYPNVSSVAAAFARIRHPWQDVRVVSLHGRDGAAQLLAATGEADWVAVFTDPTHTPAQVARLLLQNEVTGFEMCILENMGTAAERISWLGPESAAASAFADPNLVVLKRSPQAAASPPRPLFLGMPDEQFDHQNGLITKAEVRVLALSRLQLRPRDTLWDLGAGSGSLAVEAAVFIRSGLIFAVEQNPERIQQIRRNAARFGVSNLSAVQAVLPEGLEPLPDPDRIFIGGGGRNLAAIIRQAASRLKPGGRMVVNTVLLDNIQAAVASMHQLGWEADLVQAQISRSQRMPWSLRMTAHNPVWIVSGAKP
ncbi:MAG: precorrin-6y C5,15-methyltransferase (decarboxylating) subunit CbiE [Desulfobacterales bacterium]